MSETRHRQPLLRGAGPAASSRHSELSPSLAHPGGRPVRISLEVIGGGSLGEVAIDVTNLWALAQYAARRGGTQDTIRHADPAPSGKAKLRLVQGDAQ
ncbi:hypothetical protein [Streptomyces sp. DHE17-7]|uniref:hypothetical protein n=1 Tax=Streptomyces sp. DHE17-7 TaxID=2759949 RepID=UPI0022EA1406|nr:hypothetical protein [Streptomyces sp. DHE17-7]